jgi:DNA-directed RNA polymerase specialized sigma24 family protein
VWVVVDHGLLGMSFTDIARKTGNTRIKVMRAVRVARELLRGVPMEEWVELATRIQGRDKQNGIR